MRNLVWAIAFAIACSTPLAQSQQPLPSPDKAGQAQQNKSASRDRPSDDNKSDANAPPIVVNLVQPPETEEEKREKREEREQHATSERRTAISTIVIAAFTVVLAISTIFLWWDTRKSSNASRKAADAAQTAASVAQRHLEYAHRARVSVTVKDITIDADTSSITVRYECQNSGELPATNAVIAFIKGPDVGKLKTGQIKIEDENESWGIVIAPKQTIQQNGGMKYPSAEKDGSEFAVVVSYMDGFDKRRMSWRRYIRDCGEWGERGSEQQ